MNKFKSRNDNDGWVLNYLHEEAAERLHTRVENEERNVSEIEKPVAVANHADCWFYMIIFNTNI